MMKIGITGNYFSGHDEISKLFEKNGVKVFDADLLLRYFINFSPEHTEKIKSEFGDRSYSLGTLNIDKFRKRETLETLLDICEFDILLSYAKFRLANIDSPYTMFKYSFLYERQLETDFDYIINCSRSKHLREKDLKDFTRIPTPSIFALLEGEMSETEKNISSNFIIRNNNSTFREVGIPKDSDVMSQIDKIMRLLTSKNPQILGV